VGGGKIVKASIYIWPKKQRDEKLREARKLATGAACSEKAKNYMAPCVTSNLDLGKRRSR